MGPGLRGVVYGENLSLKKRNLGTTSKGKRCEWGSPNFDFKWRRETGSRNQRTKNSKDRRDILVELVGTKWGTVTSSRILVVKTGVKDRVINKSISY